MAKHQYTRADSVLTVNDNDPDLQQIDIPLPEQPAFSSIRGYGLKPDNQVWTPNLMPPRLRELNARKMTVREKWEFLSANQLAYQNEIAYIQQAWDCRLNGEWIFINGKATWITGDQYFYLTFWNLDIGLPDYRSRDRKFFIFKWFVDNDENCFGFNYPKFRREGATSKAKCCEFNLVSRTAKCHSGSQSMNFQSAEKLFSAHVIEPWRALPFFFQPVHDGTTNPKSGLFFYAPAFKMNEDNVKEMQSEELESSMTFLDSGLKAYDGRKLHFYHDDECGKTQEVDVYARWRVVRPTMRDGTDIIGKSIHTSTVGEMEKGGGRNFKKMCADSMYHDRNKNKQTKSGLYTLFISSVDGLSGKDPVTGKPFIDKFGNSDIEAATRYLLNAREAYEKENNYEALSDLIRESPIYYKECWRGSVKHCNFNSIILQSRIDEVGVKNKNIVRGNFKWVNDEKDTKVYFEPSEEGRFFVSYLFDHPNHANRQIYDAGRKYPANTTLFIAGGDPYRFKETLNGKKSDGAGAVFRKYNIAIDPPGIDLAKWQTHRFCCTYTYRPRDKNEYGEDMIKMCVYYGCEMFPEINVDFLWDYFEDRGYGGYLFYRKDPKTGLSLRTPGQTTTEKVKEAIFTEYHTYIEQHGRREFHTEILEQCLEIENDMSDFDLFVAGGYALMGAKKQTYVPAEEGLTLDDYYETYYVDAA